mmetsp:Transcript_23303/g.55100  ORF Transcript_23303/g.55100 Transcript_23303/m.55100 type:complete len:230 (-) Transcript_23303:6-695(-)
MDKGPGSVMFLPPVHVARFVIAAQQKNLVRILQLQTKQIGDAFQTLEAAVDVVAQKQKIARRQGQSQPPQIVAEKVQILQIAVNVAQHVARALQKQTPGFAFEQLTDPDGNLVQILGELFRLRIFHVVRRALKQIENALQRGRNRSRGGHLLFVRMFQMIQHLPRGNAGVATESFALGGNGRGELYFGQAVLTVLTKPVAPGIAIVVIVVHDFPYVHGVRAEGDVTSFF